MHVRWLLLLCCQPRPFANSGAAHTALHQARSSAAALLHVPPRVTPSPCAATLSLRGGRDNLFQAFTIQSNVLRRTLTFGDLLPLAAQLLDGLPSHVMQVVKMVRRK
jgi:hypothetical protein